MVQVGNEISHGMLWPDGKLPDHWQNFADYIRAGVKGVAAGSGTNPPPKIMIHIDQGGSAARTKYFFDNLNRYKIPYDVMGFSYYPWWHGSLLDLRENLVFAATTYHKDVIVAETAYHWRPNRETADRAEPFPETPEGQREFLEAVAQVVLAVPDNRGKGIFWWEPAVGGRGGLVSRSFFDESGNALPVLSAFDKYTRPIPRTAEMPPQANGAGTANPPPPVRGVENQPANPKLPSLFLIGDSTVRNGQGRGSGAQWGWGDCLAPYFDTNRINVVNRAHGGTSSRTFYRDYWPAVNAILKPGDFVIMQFGHNDGGALNDTNRARGTIRGVGDENETITNLITGKIEDVHSFGWYEKAMIAEARAKRATPMVCSLIPHNTWKDGRAVRNKDTYAGWAGQVAAAENAPFLDINEIIARRYDTLGEEAVKPLFIVGAGPHTSLAGAQTNAACVVAALKGLKKDPLARFFSKRAGAVAPADLSQPE
jgi:lysophospholipase L1-like esterase